MNSLKKSNKIAPMPPSSPADHAPDFCTEGVNLGHLRFSLGNIDACQDWKQCVQHIKELPSPISTKRLLLKRFSRKWSIQTDVGTMTKQATTKSQKFERFVSDVTYSLTLWTSSIRAIEGVHGSGVASYFTFLRWIFGLNLALFTLLLGFVILPMGLLPETQRDLIIYPNYNKSIECSRSYTVDEGTGISLLFSLLEGKGWMEKTFMFYGYYVVRLEHHYNLSLSYIMTVIACLLVSLILMTKHTAHSVKETIISSNNQDVKVSSQVLVGWDFSLSSSQTAQGKQLGVFKEFEAAAKEEMYLRDRTKRLTSKLSRCKLYLIRLLVNLVILASLAGAGCLIFSVTTLSTKYTFQEKKQSKGNSWLSLLITYLPSITITFCNGFLPVVFDSLVSFEDYTELFIIKITLLRTVLVRLASIVVLVVTLFTQVRCNAALDCTGSSSPDCAHLKCWETYVGQQFYRLVITDFFALVGFVLLLELPRMFLCSKFKLLDPIGPPQFKIPPNVLDLIYGQTLVWLGLLFTPMLPGILILKCFVVFYVKKLSALVACPPVKKSYRSSGINRFFMLVLLAAYVLCVLPVIYTMFNIKPSRGCGPYRVYDSMIESVQVAIETLPSFMAYSYNVVTSVAVTGTIILFLCVTIFFMSLVVSAYRENNKRLRDLLMKEGRNKLQLLKQINMVRRKSPAKVSNVNEGQSTLQDVDY
ncbi:unnamed protein product [Lymnaea stagnalis]|uniref:TMC domain-containing protein n=1 Tax=Lymnaea stagnalis TaxID=6523 RepID=A0AAV2HAF3_LYMST